MSAGQLRGTNIELRNLPSIDRLLNDAELQPCLQRYGAKRVRNALRALQGEFRAAKDAPDWAGTAIGYVAALDDKLGHATLQPVFNLTGTLIHTNLGRAPLAPKVWQRVGEIATRPANVEFDLGTGRRGHRDTLVAERLAAATGAEAACIVNNNAAALMLVLNTFALGKRVPVSRGELIEIGGSFRLPEIMSRAGCELAEVGTTNRTHAKDYAAAVEGAGLLLKVHPSNYHVEGFTKTVDVADMAAIAQAADLPFCVDLGSGTLTDLSSFGLPHEPMPQETLAGGADLVTFSGDKLLGSVQAGLIVGRRDLINELNNNPLKRALRVDKITLAALAATLDLYDQPDTLAQELPILRAMTTSLDELTNRGQAVAERLNVRESITATIEATQAQIGSGALPDQLIDSISVAIRTPGESQLEQLAATLRGLSVPVIGRIHQSTLWLDMRGADPLEELLTQLDQLP